MAWPTSATSRADALAQVDRTAADIKAKRASLRVAAAAGPITAYAITNDLLPRLRAAKVVFASAAAVPGIAAYVAAERGVTEQQVGNDFAAMTAALNGTLSWIEDNMPKSEGFLLIEQITTNDSGVITPRTFDSAATAGLRTQLQAIEASIG